MQRIACFVSNVPLMVLPATVVPQVEDALKSFMHDPLVERSSVNRSNIYKNRCQGMQF